MNKIGQGAIENLLITGAAIVIGLIVITLLLNIAGSEESNQKFVNLLCAKYSVEQTTNPDGSTKPSECFGKIVNYEGKDYTCIELTDSFGNTVSCGYVGN